MTVEKFGSLLTKIVVLALGIVTLGIVGAYWWANTPPMRPKGVSSEAVWLWAPYVGLPGPRRGTWLSCSNQNFGKYYCRTNDKDGALLYEGAYLPFRASTAPYGTIIIDAEKTREQGVFVNERLVPLVHLTNGEILIPAAKYDEGRKLLNSELAP